MRKSLRRFIAVAMVQALLAGGCAQPGLSPSGSAQAPGVVQKQDANTYVGRILGKSNKARTLSIEVGAEGQTKTMLVKYDDRTTGLENAVEGEAAIVTWEMRDSGRYATAIKQKLAKLPEGVTEIRPDEVKGLLDDQANFTLIDSRPENAYAQSHLPGAVSIPLAKMESGAAGLLPEDKDKLLVFYCGGYT